MADNPNDPQDPKDDASKPKASRKAASRYANASHRVGKGKPPIEHQFKKGGKPGPGRPRGSRSRSPFDKLLDERVPVGEDRLGRPIRKSWREIINRQLLTSAGKSDLSAIRLVKEYEFKLAELDRRYGESPPPMEEIRRKALEDVERQQLSANLSAKFTGYLEQIAQLKKYGVLEFRDGVPVLSPKIIQYLSTLGDNGVEPDLDTDS